MVSTGTKSERAGRGNLIEECDGADLVAVGDSINVVGIDRDVMPEFVQRLDVF